MLRILKFANFAKELDEGHSRDVKNSKTFIFDQSFEAKGQLESNVETLVKVGNTDLDQGNSL